MLDHLPAWLRHAAVAFLATALGVALPLIAAHQDSITLWLVATLRLPTWTLPLIASVVASLVLRLTTLTRKYGVGSPSVAEQTDDGAYVVTDVLERASAGTAPDAGDASTPMSR